MPPDAHVRLQHQHYIAASPVSMACPQSPQGCSSGDGGNRIKGRDDGQVSWRREWHREGSGAACRWRHSSSGSHSSAKERCNVATTAKAIGLWRLGQVASLNESESVCCHEFPALRLQRLVIDRAR